MTIAIVLLTEEGMPLARKLQATLSGGRIHGLAKRVAGADESFSDTADHLRTLFQENTTIVGICASGILVRTLAPLLSDKQREPAVIAVAEDGSVAVPLLGGHHGANALAREIAAATGGTAAITTTSDVRIGVAFDDLPTGWRIDNPELVKPVTASLLAGEDVVLECETCEASWLSDIPFSAEGKWRVLVTDRRHATDARTLVLNPPVLMLGVGCERDVEPEELVALVRSTLADAGLAQGSVAGVSSIDLKADEPAVQEVSVRLGMPLRFYSAAELEAEAPRLKTPSDIVFREVGCHGVAEGAALAAAGIDGELIVSKVRSKRATCAVARAKSPIDPAKFAAAQNGRLAVIGIGPGSKTWRSPEATHELRAADIVIGYQLYLDQIAGEISGKKQYDSKLGEEAKRTSLALELAATGKRVALVSSGDAGIYALASLVFELIDQADDDGWSRIAITVVPGISALQAAAARVGAPLGHDFCAISLSDLLTPEATILKRLEAAARGDFVVALYNPQSVRRRRLLSAARDILAAARPADTPVVIARNISREDEAVVVTTLREFDTEQVDMTTLVLIGSSHTKSIRQGGRLWTYTPRGYANARAEAGAGADQASQKGASS